MRERESVPCSRTETTHHRRKGVSSLLTVGSIPKPSNHIVFLNFKKKFKKKEKSNPQPPLHPLFSDLASRNFKSQQRYFVFCLVIYFGQVTIWFLLLSNLLCLVPQILAIFNLIPRLINILDLKLWTMRLDCLAKRSLELSIRTV